MMYEVGDVIQHQGGDIGIYVGIVYQFPTVRDVGSDRHTYCRYDNEEELKKWWKKI